MEYLRSFCLILGFSFLGELLHAALPLPIPAAIYGIVLLFLALCLRWVTVEQLQPSGRFLLSMMSVLFVSPVVQLLDSWRAAAGQLLPIALILLVSTALVFGISGLVTQALIRKRGDDRG